MNRQTFLKAAALAAVTALVVPGPLAHAGPPLIGGAGLRPNAANLAAYVRDTYPGVLSIGGVRQDRLPDHPSGRALDIMVGGNTALGNDILADIKAQAARFGVSYTLWLVPAHYDHVHVTVS